MTRDDFSDEIKGVVFTLAAVWLVTFTLVVAAAIYDGADIFLVMLTMNVTSTIVTARIGWLRLRTIYFSRLRSCER